ncbi:MAG: hypothetical protein Q8L75_12725 [Acidobacteriota bacterium]|nr:hypothetical protein [Acidobacteriota bacterium]
MSRDALVRLGLRTVAAAIAVAAIADPVLTVSRPVPHRVVVARLASANVEAEEAAIRSALPGADISVRAASHGRLPCAPGESCVIVADGSIAADWPDDLEGPVSLIRVGTPAGPNVAIQSALVAPAQSAAASGVVLATLTGTGMAGRRTEIRITDGAATVGSAVHEWTADGEAAIEVAWWPLGDGPRALRVAALPFDGEASAIDNAINVGVTVNSHRTRVLVFEARPSWASAFVRRALEDDPRFEVEHRVGLAPFLVAGTSGTRLTVPTLDAVPIVVAGGLDGLGAGEVSLLERFVRERGGTLILVPDREIAGAAARLVSGQWTEHLEASPSAVGRLRASETLRLVRATPFDTVLGAIADRPVIIVSPVGRGRVVVSGAMDAWRHRDADGGAFDRFWRSLVLESASAGEALQIDVRQPIAAPGAHVPFTVRHRQMAAALPRTVTASATCGAGAAGPIRLWPHGATGVFNGAVPMEGGEPCELRVEVEEGPVAARGIAVTTGATGSVTAVMRELERIAAQSGGGIGDAGTATETLAGMLQPGAAPTPSHPMRSPWWMSPFVACLGLEWWLRRRSGLR